MIFLKILTDIFAVTIIYLSGLKLSKEYFTGDPYGIFCFIGIFWASFFWVKISDKIWRALNG